jgi:hypothetical protein
VDEQPRKGRIEKEEEVIFVFVDFGGHLAAEGWF